MHSEQYSLFGHLCVNENQQENLHEGKVAVDNLVAFSNCDNEIQCLAEEEDEYQTLTT